MRGIISLPHEIVATERRIMAHRDILTRQEYLTLRGLINAGRPAAAVKGLETLLKRRESVCYACGTRRSDNGT